MSKCLDYAKFKPGISEKEKAGILKCIKHMEKQKRDAHKIRLMLKGRKNGSTVYILIPDDNHYEKREIKDFKNIISHAKKNKRGDIFWQNGSCFKLNGGH